MRWLLPALLLAGSVPALAQTLPPPPESRWSSLPRLVTKPGFKANSAWMERAQQLQAKGTCSFGQQRPGWTQLDIPFVVQLSAAGAVQQVVVQSIGCPPLERYVAQLIRGFGSKQIAPPRGAPPFWRASRFVAGWQNEPRDAE